MASSSLICKKLGLQESGSKFGEKARVGKGSTRVWETGWVLVEFPCLCVCVCEEDPSPFAPFPGGAHAQTHLTPRVMWSILDREQHRYKIIL